jgi:hypothetical protein
LKREVSPGSDTWEVISTFDISSRERKIIVFKGSENLNEENPLEHAAYDGQFIFTRGGYLSKFRELTGYFGRAVDSGNFCWGRCRSVYHSA